MTIGYQVTRLSKASTLPRRDPSETQLDELHGLPSTNVFCEVRHLQPPFDAFAPFVWNNVIIPRTPS